MRSSITAAVLALLWAPALGVAAVPTLLLSLPGDQTWPTMTGGKLVFVDEGAGRRDVFLTDPTIPSGPIRQVSSTGDVLGGPEAAGNIVAFRREAWVERYSLATGLMLPPIPAPGDGRVSVSQSLVAWEVAAAGGSDIAWLPMSGGAPVIYVRPGTQRAVAASYGWLAFVDDGEAGSVHLLDTTLVDPNVDASFAAADRVLYARVPGDGEPAVDVALWSADEWSAPRAAVTVALGPLDDDVLVFESPAATPVRLGTGGEKRNVHLVGSWVAYDGYSTGIAQVWLWEWTRARNFYASWSDTPQALNHLVAADDGVEIIWTGVGPQGLDIFHFALAPTPPDDPGAGEVTCATAGATVLADFTVIVEKSRPRFVRNHDDGHHDDDRDDGDHDDGHHDDGHHDDGHHDDGHHDDGWHLGDANAHPGTPRSDWTSRAFGHAEFVSPSARRVLVCMDAVGVSAAWVGAGSQVVAMPSDFAGETVSHEARVTIGAGDGRAAALVIARPGGSLRVRVLDDPRGDLDSPAAGDTCSARGDCPAPKSMWGCGSSGASASLASLLLLGLVAARPLRRSRR